MRLQKRKILSYRPEEWITQTLPEEGPAVSYNSQLPLLNQKTKHFQQECPCFKCTCGKCRCEYSTTKPSARYQNTTYNRSYIRKENSIDFKGFNCEEWRYKSSIDHNPKLNKSIDLDQSNCRPKLIVHPGQDFREIFNQHSPKESTYQRQYQAQSYQNKECEMKPKDNIVVHHDMSHFYLLQRQQKPSENTHNEQFENFKEILTKSNFRNRNLSFQFETSYKKQFPQYINAYVNQTDQSYRQNYVKTIDNLNRFKSINQLEFPQKSPLICQAKVELDIIQQNKKNISGQYYLQRSK